MDYSMDSVYLIGAGHNVCEDYAWSGLIRGQHPCIMIADGCSSSPHTDIGARIVIRGLISALNAYMGKPDPTDLYYHIRQHLMVNIVSMCKAMDLPIDSADATIRMVILYPDFMFTFHYGDGTTIIKELDSDRVFDKIRSDYSTNSPYYYTYECDTMKKHAYMESRGDGIVTIGEDTNIPVQDFIKDEYLFWRAYDYRGMSGEYIATVMSDGVETFNNGVDVLDKDDVINELIGFKNFKGEFVQRKVKMYIHRGAKQNIKHYDDISVASIKFKIEDCGNGDDNCTGK